MMTPRKVILSCIEMKGLDAGSSALVNSSSKNFFTAAEAEACFKDEILKCLNGESQAVRVQLCSAYGHIISEYKRHDLVW